MPPRRMNTTEIGQIAQIVAEAMVALGAQQGSVNGSHNTNNGGVSNSQGCSYKDFMNCKPQTFRGTEGPVGLMRWFEKLESVFRISNCAEGNKVKYATCTLLDSALTWWNSFVQTGGIDVAYATSWEDVKQLMIDEYCPRNEIQKMEEEIWSLKVKGTDISGYTNRFLELALLCPNMVAPELKKIERYISGLSPQVKGLVTSSRPATIQSAIHMARTLNDQVVLQGNMIKQEDMRTNETKRKWDGGQQRNFNHFSNKRPDVAWIDNGGPNDKMGYAGRSQYCSRCNRHHPGVCKALVCGKCRKVGHMTREGL